MPELHPDHEAVRSAIATPTELPNPEHHNLKQLPPPHVRWIRRVVIWGVGAIVVIVAVFAVGYLRFSWQRPALLFPARVLPYPVAIAGGAWISYYDYQQDIPNVSSYLERNYPPDAFEGQNLDRDTYTRKLILNKVIGESILARLGESKKIVITTEDIEKTYNDYVQQSGEPDKVPETIKALYGWTVEQFKEKLIRPQVIQDKLVEAYYGEVRSTLEGLRTQLNADVSKFADLAKEKSDDVSTSGKGGALTLTSKTLKEAYGEEAASVIEALAVNTVSSILETSRGLELIVVEKKEAAAKKDDGQNYTMRRIVLQLDPNTWLGDQVNQTAKEMRVVIFEPRFRWESECGVLTKDEPSCTQAASTSN